MIPAPLLQPIAFLLIAVWFLALCSSVERKQGRVVPQVHHWTELE